MHRFWDHIIGPLLRAADVRVLVEVGAAEGRNTERIVRWCREADARAHVIDPAPGFDPEVLLAPAGDRVVFHRALSLDVLSGLAAADAVLLDGDHNWHTVFHELRTLQAKAPEWGGFPLVFLHDVLWPYARRDLYYDPAALPEEGRRPFARGGIDPDTGKVVEGGGLNRAYHHALEEGGPRNGVLTAVEDFLAKAGEGLRFLRIPALNGLGLLFPGELEGREAFAARILALRCTPEQEEFLAFADRERMRAEFISEQQGAALDDLRLDLRSQEARLLAEKEQVRRQLLAEKEHLRRQLTAEKEQLRRQLTAEKEFVEAEKEQLRGQSEADKEFLGRKIAHLEQDLAEKQGRLRAIYESRSWRALQALRIVPKG